MRVLIDTNVLGRFSQPQHTLHGPAHLALKRLAREGNELRLIPQVLYEFWVVATRPAEENGLGFSTDETDRRITRFIRLFPLLRDERGIFEPWYDLVRSQRVQGKQAHDARLAAAMHRHALTHILTFNGNDFARYPEVQVIDPHKVATQT